MLTFTSLLICTRCTCANALQWQPRLPSRCLRFTDIAHLEIALPVSSLVNGYQQTYPQTQAHCRQKRLLASESGTDMNQHSFDHWYNSDVMQESSARLYHGVDTGEQTPVQVRSSSCANDDDLAGCPAQSFQGSARCLFARVAGRFARCA